MFKFGTLGVSGLVVWGSVWLALLVCPLFAFWVCLVMVLFDFGMGFGVWIWRLVCLGFGPHTFCVVVSFGL